ncbi:MAG: Hpt domain-containing protein, partial [Prosthecochloris sp.]|nr:Hpt domain-containing protein [Prosthecochloris sp.]
HLGKPVSQQMLAKTFSTWLPEYVRNFNAETSQTPNPSVMDDLLNEVHNQCIINDDTIESLRETGGDELLEQLIGIYLEDTKKIIDGIIKASTDGDTESINRLSHTLKGSSGSVGAQKMHILATHLNQLAKSTHNNDYSDWISTMQETFSETMKEFQTLRNTP